MSAQGWIKLYRGFRDHWLWKKSRPFSAALAWVDLILRCNHAPARIKTKTMFVQLGRGQFHTAERSLAAEWGWDRKRVRRFLEALESDGMIQKVVQKSTTGRTTEGTTITVLNYGYFQDSVTTDTSSNDTINAPTKEPLAPPKQEVKERNKDSKDNPGNSVLAFLNEQAGTNYKSTVTNLKLIHTRVTEGYALEDFKIVISRKVVEWQGTDMAKYLRPSTLFGPKFDNYLNEPGIISRSRSGREEDNIPWA